MPHTLAIDIETFSPVDLKKSGAYKYAAHPDFEILIIGYKVDDFPAQLLPFTDPDAGDVFECDQFLDMLTDPTYLKTAFNAPFERTCLAAYFKMDLPADQWECTQAKAYTCGLAGGLDLVAQVLQLGEKIKEGYSLIRYFCLPCRPTKVNGGRTRNYPYHEPEKFRRFQQYCLQDVELEYRVRKLLGAVQHPPHERALWVLDQKINDRGVRVDTDFVNKAIAIDRQRADEMYAQAVAITGLDNPGSVKQLKKWIEDETGEEIENLRKENLPALIKKLPQENVLQLLDLRQKMSKTSTKKYVKMLDCLNADGYVRGMLQYAGASRTWRWAGRLIQLHNLPKTQIEDLEHPSRSVNIEKGYDELSQARAMVRAGDSEGLQLCYHSVPEVLSMLIRTAFIPSPGRRFIISDFSAIEARVTAWLAGETWRLEIFRNKGKIYEASAAAMFRVPIETVTKKSIERQKGKMAELALGYQGGPAAIQRIEIGNRVPPKLRIPEAELPGIVQAWRAASPRIVQLWYSVQDCAFTALNNPGATVSLHHHINFQVKNHVLFITLPSGRKLSYLRPRIIEGVYGPTISYEGMDQVTKKWGRVDTYGGKLTENLVQAIARDLLAYAMLNVDAAGYDIALHVHDEIANDVPYGQGSVEEINEIMRRLPPWADGLPLDAESFESDYYKKD